METKLSQQEATKFFSAFCGGEHHLPSKLKAVGAGWAVHLSGELATYDFDHLTRLVIMAHDACFRLRIKPLTPSLIEVSIWKRQREGNFAERHPTIEDAIKGIRERMDKYPQHKYETEQV